jgi:hypothetical protein
VKLKLKTAVPDSAAKDINSVTGETDKPWDCVALNYYYWWDSIIKCGSRRNFLNKAATRHQQLFTI